MKKRARTAKWAYLLDEEDFGRWYRNLSMGSEYTAKERARVLYRFVVRQDMTPRSLAEFARTDVRQVEDLLMDFVSELRQEGKAPSYIESYLISIKSWLNFNGVRLVRRIKVGNTNLTPTIEDERVPTPDELLQILNCASARGSCSIALMAFAGVRPEVLGNMNGKDGLEIRDFPEMEIEGGKVTFTKIPTRVNVRPSLSKSKHKYFTFLNSEGCDYIKAYLERRLAMGEELGQRSAIISIKPGYEKTGFRKNVESPSGHIVTKTLTKEIRDAMRPRFTWRPYVLRCYFDTQLLIAENNGKISSAYRAFFMGHVGNIEARYTTNKGRLPDAVIEDMRRTIVRSDEYLSTRSALDADEAKKKWFLELTKAQYPEYAEEIENIMKISSTYEDAVVAFGTFKKEREKRRKGIRVHSMEEVERLLDEGWADVREMSDGSFFVKRD